MRRFARYVPPVVALLLIAGCGDDGAPGGTAPGGGRPSDVCGSIERLDPAPLLDGAVAKHLPCRSDSASGSLGVAVWTAAGGLRVSVSVIDNGKASPGVAAATFDELYRQAPAPLRCAANAPGRGAPLRCLDKTATGQPETGTFILDEGASYLVVWLSDESGHSAGIDVAPTRRRAFLAFVADAAAKVYGFAPQLPDAPASPGPAGTSSSPAAAGGSVAAQLAAAGYQRTTTGHYYAQELQRDVAIEEWKPVSDHSLPTVHLTEARPGAPGNPAVSEVSFDSGFGEYQRFWCVPTARYAFNPSHVIDQARTARQMLEQGRAEPGPGQNDTHTMVSVDGTVTCYLK